MLTAIPGETLHQHRLPAVHEQACSAGLVRQDVADRAQLPGDSSASARGYVAEACFDDEILKAVMEVARGRIFLNGEMAQKMIAHTLGGERSPMQGLSGRELEVFGRLAEGRSVEEIAAMLHLSQKTVFNYQTALRQKLGISSPIDLLRMAQQLGLIAK